MSTEVDASKFPPLSICGIGDVRGLLGANCRHSIGPGDGRFNPFEGLYDSEENRKREELEKRQRLLERRIRATKREVMGLKTGMDAMEDPAGKAELKAKYQEKARKLQRQNKEYQDYCKENGLKPLSERLQIARWDRKQAASATAAARADIEKYSKYRYNEDGTIVVTDDWKNRNHPHLSAKYRPYAVIETVSQNGKEEQRNRTIYGPDARQSLQVHGGPHGNSKKHPYGKHGEHVHRIVWEDDKIISREPDELTDQEKKEYKDIL